MKLIGFDYLRSLKGLVMQKIKQKLKGGKVYYPDDWLFNEYLSFFKMYIGRASQEFNIEEIKRIKVVKKGDEYLLLGRDGKEYLIEINKDSTHVQVYDKKNLVYDENINL